MKNRDLGIFVIDQEIDDINKFYSPEINDNDKFSSEEESVLHSKLNDIIEQLHKQGPGQEIIFDEIESLKSHLISEKRLGSNC